MTYVCPDCSWRNYLGDSFSMASVYHRETHSPNPDSNGITQSQPVSGEKTGIPSNPFMQIRYK